MKPSSCAASPSRSTCWKRVLPSARRLPNSNYRNPPSIRICACGCRRSTRASPVRSPCCWNTTRPCGICGAARLHAGGIRGCNPPQKRYNRKHLRSSGGLPHESNHHPSRNESTGNPFYGRKQHCLLLEFFTNKGIGTAIIPDEGGFDNEELY